jgi:hypothetical protein
MTPLAPTTSQPDQSASIASDVSASDSGSASELNSGFNYLDDLPGLVAGMQTNVIDVYNQGNSAYLDYLARIATLKDVISNSIGAGNDANHVNINGAAIQTEIQHIIDDFGADAVPPKPMYVSKSTGADGLAEARAWADQWHLDPNTVVVPVGNTGQYQVLVDVSPLQQLKGAIKSGNITVYENTSMMSTIDSRLATPTNQEQVILELFGRQNSSMLSLSQMVTSAAAQISQILNGMWR